MNELRERIENKLFKMLTDIHSFDGSMIQGAEMLAEFLDGEDPEGGLMGIRMFCSDFAESVLSDLPSVEGCEWAGRKMIREYLSVIRKEFPNDEAEYEKGLINARSAIRIEKSARSLLQSVSLRKLDDPTTKQEGEG